MRLVRRPRSLRSLSTGLAVVVLVVVAGPLGPGPALADVGTDAPVLPGSTVVGELVQAYDDPESPSATGAPEPADADTAGLLSWVQTDSGTAVRVPTDDLPDVDAGATVAVTVGGTVADEATAQGLQPARDVLATDVLAAPDTPPVAPASVASDHQVTVVLALPPGATPDGTTPAGLQGVVDGSVASFWRSQTGGQVSFRTVATRDWIPLTAGCSDPFGMWSQAAAQVGWTSAPGAHLLVYVPDEPATATCSYGLGTVGSAGMAGGGMAYVKATRTSVIAHEFGHHLGLGHSSAVQCDRSVDTGTCQTVGYGDYYDVMGFSWDQLGTLDAPQEALLGLLPPAQQPGISASDPPSTRTLVPISASSGVRTIRLTDAEGATYWLEYRAASGQDSWLGQPSANWPGMQTGVTLRRSGQQPDTSLLFDGTPSPSSGWSGDRQVALPIGSPVSVSGGDFVVTVTSVTATQATVRVTTSGGSPATGQPTGSPVGSMDEVTRRPGGVLVGGWAYDPDAPDVVVPIAVSVDGAAATVSSATDVTESPFAGAGALQGFARVVAVPGGTHQVCAWAQNAVGAGSTSSLGCRNVS